MTQSSDKKIVKLSPEILQAVGEKLEGTEREPEIPLEEPDDSQEEVADEDPRRDAAKKFAEAITERVTKKISINTRLSTQTHRELRTIAREEDRSIQSLVQEGVRLVLLARKLRGIAWFNKTTPEAMIHDFIQEELGKPGAAPTKVHKKKGS